MESLQLIWREERARLQGCEPPPPSPDEPRTPFDVCLLVTAARQDFQKIIELSNDAKEQKFATSATADGDSSSPVNLNRHISGLETPGGEGTIQIPSEDEGFAEDEQTPQYSRSQHPVGAGATSRSPLLATLEPAALLSTGPTLDLAALSPAGSPGASQTLLAHDVATGASSVTTHFNRSFPHNLALHSRCHWNHHPCQNSTCILLMLLASLASAAAVRSISCDKCLMQCE